MNRIEELTAWACLITGMVSCLSRSMEKAPGVSSYVVKPGSALKSLLPSGWRR